MSARLSASGLRLDWDSQPGASYHVEAKVMIGDNDWTDVSGPITASGTSTSFTDANWTWYATGWYRVVSE